MNPSVQSDTTLLGLLLDGPADAGIERELARRAAADRTFARLLRRHLQIAELAEQRALPERGATAFADGWEVRRTAEADAAVFTARTMLHIVADRSERRSGWILAGLRTGGLAAAALLFVCIGWVGSALYQAGREWVSGPGGARVENPAIVQRGQAIRELREELR